MKKAAAAFLAILLSVPGWSEDSPTPAEPPVSAAPAAAKPNARPFPHSTGAKLLPYCEKTDDVISQLRCNYYIQGVADAASMSREGKPLACIPQGQNQTQLTEIALAFLKTVEPQNLETQSAAFLILRAFNKAFPCPTSDTAKAIRAAAKESRKQGEAGTPKETDAPK